jgi:excisionase family DNA binding protein
MSTKLLTEKEAAAAMGITVNRLKNLIRARRVTFVQLGVRGRRVPEHAVEAWIARQTVNATAETAKVA